MATTKLSNRGSRRLNDREMRFVLEYLLDFNATRAVKAAGYTTKNDRNASVMGCKLLQRRPVADMVGKLRKETRDKLELSREEILLQLYYLATRSGADFVTKQGILIQNLNDLPERAQQAVDGIEQEIVTITYDDGSTVQKVKTKLKLVGKAQAIEMAMRHKGLFAPGELNIGGKVRLDWDELLQGPNGEPDVIEGKILEAGGNGQKQIGQDKGAKR